MTTTFDGASPGDLAISTRNLRKTYRSATGRRSVAVQGLDLDVPLGGVHGFLGPNGSGKTTSIRMLLGLIHADAGTMNILGYTIPRQLPEVIGRIGAIVEQPKFFPTMSARRNLEILAKGIGAPERAVAQVLEDVGLTDRGKDLFKTYSLGMKQRLAIAATLLKNPDLLIFDEPTNGLDPAGIHEIRETMRSLGASGKTVLVSSHILSEVEHVADTVTIIGRGRTLAQGRVKDLLASQATTTIRVGIDQPDAAERVLREGGLGVSRDGVMLAVTGVDDPAEITRRLAHHDLWVSELVAQRAGLEAFFLELTAGEGPGTTAGVPQTPHTPGMHAAPASPAAAAAAPPAGAPQPPPASPYGRPTNTEGGEA
ncbi:ABC transporter ATP-binding protein [Sanguibacter sp. A247]|uniref:ABC transporter ATP-binding protein n=1 Tax=unclassified Sanguibacter TaxID=2645534 RepID=UPI003FD81BCE